MRLIHKKDFFILILLFGLALFLTLLLKLPYLFNTVIIFGSPSVYILSRLKHNRGHVLLFSLIVGLLLGLVVEIIATAGNAWHVQQTIPWRILGFGYWEDLIWAFLYTFFVILSYKHFVEYDYQVALSKNFLKLLMLIIFSNALLFGLFFVSGGIPRIEFAYAWIGFILVIPFFIYTLLLHPHLLKKGLPIFIFFTISSFIYEVVMLGTGSYWFPGNYVFHFPVLSKNIPIEDVIFWMILTAPTLIGMYEYFVED